MAYCSPWSHKQLDMIYRLNNNISILYLDNIIWNLGSQLFFFWHPCFVWWVWNFAPFLFLEEIAKICINFFKCLVEFTSEIFWSWAVFVGRFFIIDPITLLNQSAKIFYLYDSVLVSLMLLSVLSRVSKFLVYYCSQ